MRVCTGRAHRVGRGDGTTLFQHCAKVPSMRAFAFFWSGGFQVRMHSPFLRALPPSGRLAPAYRGVALTAPLILLSGYLLYGMTTVRLDSPAIALRHLAAFPNCRIARAVGLAPADRGEAGYWPTHDRDWDGRACEGRRGSAAGVRVHRH